jgi:NADH:ubiquinone oxidoreductase subunit F (NADH-binding)
MNGALATRPREHASGGAVEPALPRLLSGTSAGGPLTLERHLATHGAIPKLPAKRRRAESPLIARVERAGLRGRGGAAFPTARKLSAVAHARGRAIVVVNVAEGEPASLKDRTLCEAVPHLMLDGAELAARAVGADELIVCVCESASDSLDSVSRALEERDRLLDARARTALVPVPATYLAGQESALVNFLGGGAAVPTFTPPLPSERGVRRRPTLVSNAETLAHLALIARHGSRWFRQLGTASQPGSTLVTLSGPLARPGVYEVACGTSLSSLMQAAGGITAGVHGALLGGYAGGWLRHEELSGARLCDEDLAPLGASVGAGVVALLSAEACPVAETARVARWMASQSTRQCGPCIHGLDALAQHVAAMAAGRAERRALRRVEHLSSLVQGRGACSHPDGGVRFILSALRAFSSEFSDHARHGPCPACARSRELPLPVAHGGAGTQLRSAP